VLSSRCREKPFVIDSHKGDILRANHVDPGMITEQRPEDIVVEVLVGQRDGWILLGDLLSGSTLGKRSQHFVQSHARAAQPYHSVGAGRERRRLGRQRFRWENRQHGR